MRDPAVADVTYHSDERMTKGILKALKLRRTRLQYCCGAHPEGAEVETHRLQYCCGAPRR